MKSKLTIFSTLLLTGFAMSPASAASVITDGFSTLNTAWIINTNSDAVGGNLAFSALNLSSYTNAPDNTDSGVIGIHEDGAATGADNQGTMTRTFNLANYSGLTMTIDIAQFFGGSWEGTEFFSVEADTGTGFVQLYKQLGRLSTGASGTSTSADDISTGALALGAAADNNTSVDVRLTFNTGFWSSIADVGGSNGSEAYLLQNFQVNGTLIPEPSAALLGGLGMIVLLRRRR